MINVVIKNDWQRETPRTAWDRSRHALPAQDHKCCRRGPFISRTVSRARAKYPLTCELWSSLAHTTPLRVETPEITHTRVSRHVRIVCPVWVWSENDTRYYPVFWTLGQQQPPVRPRCYPPLGMGYYEVTWFSFDLLSGLSVLLYLSLERREG